MNLFETRLIQKAGDAGSKLKVKSALNPALWLCAIVTIPGIFIIAIYYKEPPLWLMLIVLLPVIIAVVGFLFLLLFDRDKLQSEDYQIRKKTLEIIQEKGDSFPMVATSFDAITNPQKFRLKSHNGDK